jgi:hypothetical protein
LQNKPLYNNKKNTGTPHENSLIRILIKWHAQIFSICKQDAKYGSRKRFVFASRTAAGELKCERGKRSDPVRTRKQSSVLRERRREFYIRSFQKQSGSSTIPHRLECADEEEQMCSGYGEIKEK